MKDLTTIGLPSKGRLKESVLNLLKKNNLKLTSKGGDRDYFANLDNLPNTQVIYLHAREIIERLGDGTLDIGISGLDLLNESAISLQKRIEITKKLDFGKANLVVAVPNDWIDVQTIADLEEISFYFRDKKNLRLRVATKYPNLTNNFLTTKGITQYKIVSSLGATETYPFTGSSEIITDITSTGSTLEANNLRVLKDGTILKSQACVLISKKNKKKAARSGLSKLFFWSDYIHTHITPILTYLRSSLKSSLRKLSN